jgi:hypothetical protein
VWDEKMLEKLTMHDIQDVAELFSLADKCTRAAEGCAWHTPPAPKARKGAKPDASTTAHGSGSRNNNTKADSNNQSLTEAPTVAAATVAAGGV